MTPEEREIERRRLRRFLGRGGTVVREEIGGAIGVRACGAARNGREFSGEILDRLIEQGFTFNRQPLRVVCAPDRPSTFAAIKADAP